MNVPSKRKPTRSTLPDSGSQSRLAALATTRPSASSTSAYAATGLPASRTRSTARRSERIRLQPPSGPAMRSNTPSTRGSEAADSRVCNASSRPDG